MPTTVGEGREGWALRATGKRLNPVILSETKSDFATPMGSIGPQKSVNPRSYCFKELRRSFVAGFAASA
jgi:hypothetical protein